MILFQSLLVLVPALSCPHPVYTLADGSLSASVNFEMTSGGKTRAFTVQRNSKAFTIEYDIISIAPSRGFRIYASEMGFNECNSIIAEPADFAYFRDSAIALLMGYCHGATPEEAGRFFSRLRFEPPVIANELRTSWRRETAAKCPVTTKAFEILKRSDSHR